MRSRGLARVSSLGAFSALLLCISAGRVAAFSVRSEVDAQKIGLQDQLQLTITVEGADAPEVPLPALTNLQVVGGPFQSTQVSIVTGRMSQSRSFTYVLQPKAVGKAEIGPVKASDQTAPAIPVEIVAGSVRPAQPQRRPGLPGIDPFATDPFANDPFGDPFERMFGRRRGRTTEPKVLVEAVPSRSRLHVGEPLALTYYLYTQASVSDVQPKEALQYGGFWVEDLEGPQTKGETATLGGESYRRFPLLRKLLFPTRSGAVTLPAAGFRIHLASQGFFDSGGTVDRTTKPLTITVDPLPDSPGFSGAVGRFTASASLDRDVVALGEAATLRFRVEGTGNLKWIDKAPTLVASGAKVFPPQTKSDLRTTTEGVTGSRTWEFVVVPQTSGTVEIPPLAFSWFDPAAGKIVSSETKPLSLRVEGGTVAAGVPAGLPPAVASAGTGALPLRSDLDLRPAARIALGSRGLVVLLGAGLLFHAGLWGAERLRDLARRRPRHASSSRSLRAALRDLERAGADGLTKEQAAGLVEKALHEAFGEMGDHDESERARAVRELLDEVHFVRYAPQLGDYSDKIRTLAERGAAAVRKWA